MYQACLDQRRRILGLEAAIDAVHTELGQDVWT